MSQRTLLLLSQDNAHYERLLKAANLPICAFCEPITRAMPRS